MIFPFANYRYPEYKGKRMGRRLLALALFVPSARVGGGGGLISLRASNSSAVSDGATGFGGI